MRFDAIRIFLWGYARDRVYADKPSTLSTQEPTSILEHFKKDISQVMAELPPNMCLKVVENYLKKIKSCNTSRGGLLSDVYFHP